ncbi:glucan biosynthesis protein [Salinarimonas ramus]|uniref:Glucans biosynthesis protein G n=1 Tax=Salinarimonas ramus TaxID=690164 RepID=A0A917V329_9HYPH|nr:glucan biosynthesis protein G [Salinarimonas ramus]GGK28750.1 glucans biosynthesis protein G [Salinarimonas ramus]
MSVTRRSVLALAAALALAPRPGSSGRALAAALASSPDHWGEPEPFRPALVRERAQALAAAPFEPPPETVPDALAGLDYDQYRDIRFRPESAIWAGTSSPFQLQFFHLGFGYRAPVAIRIVENGASRKLIFDPAMFSYGPLVENPPTAIEDLGFSGFRIHTPINRDDYFDEFAVFQGASYFRAVGKDQAYGLSARGLAIATADPAGEEFPTFREFWIETPGPDADTIVVHALLDSPSTTGAYRFTLRPGASTAMEVEAVLYPRVEITTVGIAPLTSMFYFSGHDRIGIDDFRGAVHDSDGLLMWNGQGEWLWRPILNPQTLQISTFLDNKPHGFGLMQREREFAVYQDLEADYHRRPSLWVEPIGDWGEGSVVLVEIPTDAEVHDNIVAFWRPRLPLAAGVPVQMAYRLHWRGEPPVQHGLAKVRRTLSGLSEVGRPQADREKRVFVVDFQGEGLVLPDAAPITVQASASSGILSTPVIKTDPEIGGVRVALELDPDGAEVCELRCALVRDGAVVSETWLYRWLPA